MILLIATQLRGLFGAAWVAKAVDGSLGLRAAMSVLTSSLTVLFVLLALGAGVVFAFAGKKRELGVSFDLACVAALPLVYVDIAATAVVRGLDIETPMALSYVLSGLSIGWYGVLLAFSVLSAQRRRARRIPPPPVEIGVSAKRAGIVVLVVALCGAIAQVSFIAQNLDDMRPMQFGEPAPQLALPRVGPDGELGAPIDLASFHGRPVVIDFWATWCGPCQKAMPELNHFAERHPEVTVLSVNLDDPSLAREMLTEGSFGALTLLAGDGATSDRYGVTTIPHIVFVDRDGMVQDVARGGADVEARYARLAK